MQYPWAVAGQEVVCITDTWGESLVSSEQAPACHPRFMQNYVIEEVANVKCGGLDCPGHIVLGLKGIPDFYWQVEAFAPVQKIGENEVTTSALERSLALLND